MHALKQQIAKWTKLQLNLRRKESKLGDHLFSSTSAFTDLARVWQIIFGEKKLNDIRHGMIFLSLPRQYEATMDEMQNDIDNLEREKAEMKKRLDAYSKKSLLQDLARHASSSSSIAAVVAGVVIMTGHDHLYAVKAYAIKTQRQSKVDCNIQGVVARETCKSWLPSQKKKIQFSHQ